MSPVLVQHSLDSPDIFGTNENPMLISILDTVFKLTESSHYFLVRYYYNDQFNSSSIISSDVLNNPFNTTQFMEKFQSKVPIFISDEPFNFDSIGEHHYFATSIDNQNTMYLVLLHQEKFDDQSILPDSIKHLLNSAIDKEIVDINYLIQRCKSADKSFIDNLAKPTFSIIDLNPEEVLFSILCCFMYSDFSKKIDIDFYCLAKFVITVRSMYNNVPYHNWIHAADATQCIFYLVRTYQIDELINPEESFSLLLSALCHDIGHDGKTNQYHRAVNSIYSQQAGPLLPPLEYHHAVVTINLLKKFPELLAPIKDIDRFAESITHIILATDMTRHQEFIDKIKNQEISLESDQGRILICQILMKASDLSNTIRPFEDARIMATRLQDEWFQQGDAEREAGIPITKGYDRKKLGRLCDGQLGFYKFCAAPLMYAIDKYFNCDANTVRFEQNLATWENIANQ